MKKNFTTWFIIFGFGILLMSCKQKGHEVKPTLPHQEVEQTNDKFDTAGGEDSSNRGPSSDAFDSSMKTTNAEDEYNDRLDNYLDDREDELRFDPEIFDFQDE